MNLLQVLNRCSGSGGSLQPHVLSKVVHVLPLISMQVIMFDWYKTMDILTPILDADVYLSCEGVLNKCMSRPVLVRYSFSTSCELPISDLRYGVDLW